MRGKPCIRWIRVTVGMIVEALSAGHTIEQLLVDFRTLRKPISEKRSALLNSLHRDTTFLSPVDTFREFSPMCEASVDLGCAGRVNLRERRQ
jgi:hypothetical protein